MNNLSVGEFSIGNSGGMLLIKGADGNISLSPAESSKLIDLIALALQATNLPAVPPVLSYSPFEVVFNEDGDMRIGRKEGGSSVKFTATTGDDLISVVDMGLKKLADELRIKGGARGGVSSYNPRDPVIDGR